MHNKHRLTTLMIVFTLIFSAFTSASFADNAADGEKNTLALVGDSSVERMKAFGMLNETDLATEANSSVTRAQFVTWAIKVLDLSVIDGTPRFSDVPDSHPAAGYINAACDMGFVSEGETFNPDSPILYNEAVKILVNIAGYNPAAQENGGYPAGYVTMAARVGILDNVSIKDAELPALDAIKMIDNTLDAYIMDTDYNGSYKVSSYTILGQYLNIDKVEVRITEVDRTERQIKVIQKNGEEKTYDLAKSVNANEIVEDDADIYVAKTRFDEEVVYIDFKGTIAVYYDYISEVNKSTGDLSYTTGQIENIYLTNEDKRFSMNSEAVVTVNDESLESISANLVGTFAKIVVRDNGVSKIEAYTLYEGGLLSRADTEKIKYVHGEINDNAMEGIDKIDDFQIFLDGTPTTDIYSLKKNYVFDYYISADEKKLILVVSSRSYSGTLSGTTGDRLIVGENELAISAEYGLHVYSNTRERYLKGGSLDSYMGKEVTAMVDDNMCVRYIKISDDAENVNSFYGVAMEASTGDNPFDSNEARIKVYKITGGQGEKVYYTDAQKMARSPIKMDYVREYAGDTEGKSFLKFTLSKEDKITKVEEVDLWGNSFKFSSSIGKTSVSWIGNLNVSKATLFAVFKESGKCKVKVIDFKTNLRDTAFPGGVTVVSDYNPTENPLPNFVMFGAGSENHRTNGTQSGFVKEVSMLEDDMVSLKFTQPYGTDSYTVTGEFYRKNADALRKNNYIEWYFEKFTENPIEIYSYRDFSGDTSTWPDDNATYTSGTTSGLYRADKILYRDGNCIQFMVNGEPSDVIPLNEYYAVYEVQHTKTGNTITKKSGTNVLGYINQNDNVWVQIVPWSPSPRSALIVIYEKNRITGD